MFLKEKEIGGERGCEENDFFIYFFGFGIFNIGFGGFIEILRRI